MKWFHLFPAVTALALAAPSLADDFARTGMAAQAQSGPEQSWHSRPYMDYPVAAYPAGFSSYRGLGFMGTCCEQNSPGTQGLWTDYCAPQGCGPKACYPKLFDGKLLGWLHGGCKPHCTSAKCCTAGCATGCKTGCATGCNSCGDSCCDGRGANYWPVAPGCRPCGLGWHGLKGYFHGLHNGCAVEGCSQCAGEAAPATSAEPTPAPQAISEPPSAADPVPAPKPDPAVAPQADPPPVPKADSAPGAQAEPPAAPPSLPPPPTSPAGRSTRMLIPTPNGPLSIPTPSPSYNDKAAWRIEPRHSPVAF